jgi:hypothetical protein
MLFIGEATLFSSVPVLFGDGSSDEIKVLKLKNPRTSVGTGAFRLAEFLKSAGHRTRANKPEHDEAHDDSRHDNRAASGSS